MRKILPIFLLSLLVLIPSISAEELDPIENEELVVPDFSIVTDDSTVTDDYTVLLEKIDNQNDLLGEMNAHLWWINTVWIPGVILFLLLAYCIFSFLR